MNPEVLAQLISRTAHDLVASGQAGQLANEMIPAEDKIAVMRPKDRSHGDWATNIAMQLGKKAGMAPRDLAQKFAQALQADPGIASVEVAGPGFINITLNAASASQIVDQILNQKAAFGTNDHLAGKTLNLEFVSANPTGPIHIGGTRWAAIGDALARILQANGAHVIREYYFNDHGEQINRFAKSLVAAAHGEEAPADGYKGAYIDEIAQKVIDQAKAEGIDVLSLPRVDGGKDADGQPLGEGDSEQREEFRKRAVPMMFDEIKQSMADFRVNFDVYFHENSVYEDGEVDAAFQRLKDLGDIYRKDGATWFKSTKYGDDKDRVIIKSNGEAAYIMGDIAYYWNKRHRKQDPADIAIYMLGADHHGYVNRLQAVCAAFGDEPNYNMQILIGQLVNVVKGGQPVRMSKRAGNVVTIDDLVGVVGVDATRYSLERTSYTQNIDIDLDLLSQHSNENPVYYVQYAHARSKNVDRNAAAAGLTVGGADLSLLDTEADSEILAQLALYPSVVASAADLNEPHRLAHYLEDLAGKYHQWYAAERVVPMELTEKEAQSADAQAIKVAKDPEPARAAARLKLNDAAAQVFENGLGLLAVTAPDKM
ncbi:arginine--tRNA ligase [Parascardovia denticolens]|uniref:arginine--tRNA ligase n=1 Tax=Parascardovia denticolens TaxID=78258 RepID=UPI00248D81A0|nr:arginine--tRNA ligase [Parascardovia denticolens]